MGSDGPATSAMTARASGSLRAPTQLTFSRLSRGVVQADTAEIHRHLVFDGRTTTWKMLRRSWRSPMARVMRDSSASRCNCSAKPPFVRQPFGDVAVVADDRAHRRVVEQVRGDAFEPDPVAVLVPAAPDRGNRLARARDQLLHGVGQYRQIVGMRVLGAAVPEQFVGLSNPRRWPPRDSDTGTRCPHRSARCCRCCFRSARGIGARSCAVFRRHPRARGCVRRRAPRAVPWLRAIPARRAHPR